MAQQRSLSPLFFLNNHPKIQEEQNPPKHKVHHQWKWIKQVKGWCEMRGWDKAALPPMALGRLKNGKCWTRWHQDRGRGRGVRVPDTGVRHRGGQMRGAEWHEGVKYGLQLEEIPSTCSLPQGQKGARRSFSGGTATPQRKDLQILTAGDPQQKKKPNFSIVLPPAYNSACPENFQSAFGYFTLHHRKTHKDHQKVRSARRKRLNQVQITNKRATGEASDLISAPVMVSGF